LIKREGTITLLLLAATPPNPIGATRSVEKFRGPAGFRRGSTHDRRKNFLGADLTSPVPLGKLDVIVTVGLPHDGGTLHGLTIATQKRLGHLVYLAHSIRAGLKVNQKFV
jgi:hypothetical protein